MQECVCRTPTHNVADLKWRLVAAWSETLSSVLSTRQLTSGVDTGHWTSARLCENS